MLAAGTRHHEQCAATTGELMSRFNAGKTRRSAARAASACMLVIALLPLGSTRGQSPSEKIVVTTNLLRPASTSPKSTCANFASESLLSCIYLDWSGPVTRVNLYEITSADGGASWSAPNAVTTDPGDEYDPFIQYDAVRKRLWLAYAKWHNDKGGSHNDVVIRHKDCGTCAWSSPTSIAGDGINDYWIPSVLVTHDGALLAFYTKNGPESTAGIGSGVIELRRSTDAGLSWQSAVTPTATCDSEYARAIENSFGSILLVFGRYVDASHLPKGTRCADGVNNHYPFTDIHQIWSADGGATWQGESVLYHSAAGSALHPFVAAEKPDPQASCATCRWDLLFVSSSDTGKFAVYWAQSTNQGLVWSPPQRLSQTQWSSPFNVDPGLVVGCAGRVANFTPGYGSEGMFVERIDGNLPCASH
jgi:BNR repeat-like domain